MNDEQLLRYSRHILLPQIDIAGQQKLMDSKVLIVGLGGLGSPVAMYLAASGVGHLVLNDFDVVDASNLQRQIVHCTATIGLPKVISAQQQLFALNPDVKITLLAHRLEEQALIECVKDIDLIIDCTDNLTTRLLLNRVSRITRTPLIFAATIRMEGQLSVFDPRIAASPCYCCLYSEDTQTEQSCSENGIFAPMVGILGSLQALEALKLLIGIGESMVGRLLLIDGMTMDFQEIQLAKNQTCKVCSQNY